MGKATVTEITMVTHKGGCHCGRVQFEVDAPADLELTECNCSVCHMSGFLHLIVPKSRFRLLTDWSELSCYTFNTHIAKHYFCGHCGIKPFYIPRSNPDGISVNARCIDQATVSSSIAQPFDGQNWELNSDRLAHLSTEEPA